MLQCLERVGKEFNGCKVSPVNKTSSNSSTINHKDHKSSPSPIPSTDDGKSFNTAESLIHTEEFRRLLKIHNKIQAVQCFQYPPNALCCDSKELVREVRKIHKRHNFSIIIPQP